MKTLNLKEMEVIEGGIKFWGSDLDAAFTEMETDSTCPSGYATVTYAPYYVLWIHITEKEQGRTCIEEQ